MVDRATERDPAWALAEYSAEFRRDIESFASIEAIEACTERGTYVGFVDPQAAARPTRWRSALRILNVRAIS